MCNWLTRKGNRIMGMILIAIATFTIGVSLALFWLKRTPKIASQPREAPIPFEPTKENGGRRCQSLNYVGVPRTDNYNPVCYGLQMDLTKAAIDGNLSLIREALRKGAHPNGSVDDYDPPLSLAVNKGHTDAVRLLLDNGADVNQGTFIRGTPLITAALKGRMEILEILLERGADVCYRSDAGTAKEVAERLGYEDIVALLEDAQASKCK